MKYPTVPKQFTLKATVTPKSAPKEPNTVRPLLRMVPEGKPTSIIKVGLTDKKKLKICVKTAFLRLICVKTKPVELNKKVPIKIVRYMKGKKPLATIFANEKPLATVPLESMKPLKNVNVFKKPNVKDVKLFSSGKE